MAGTAEKILAGLKILNDPDETKDDPVQAPALNVTRVGGLAAFIAAAGAAALTLFNIEKTDDLPLRIAAIAATAAIVAASLFAAAIIIAADVRARSLAAASGANESEKNGEPSDTDKYLSAFQEAMKDADRGGYAPSNDLDDIVDLRRLARAYRAMVSSLEQAKPPDRFRDEHTNLRLEAQEIFEEADRVAGLSKGAERQDAARILLQRVFSFRAEVWNKLREL